MSGISGIDDDAIHADGDGMRIRLRMTGGGLGVAVGVGDGDEDNEEEGWWVMIVIVDNDLGLLQWRGLRGGGGGMISDGVRELMMRVDYSKS
jgi:hypothetical protein